MQLINFVFKEVPTQERYLKYEHKYSLIYSSKYQLNLTSPKNSPILG